MTCMASLLTTATSKEKGKEQDGMMLARVRYITLYHSVTGQSEYLVVWI